MLFRFRTPSQSLRKVHLMTAQEVISSSISNPLTTTPGASNTASFSLQNATTTTNINRPKLVLAPMVRTGELPTRLMALKYGADLIWTPEIVDKAIIGTIRTPNPSIGCIDFLRPQKPDQNKKRSPDSEQSRLIFRTHTSLEKEKLIFQIGSSTPELAVEAAKIVARDVSGIDLNSGCPKHFSIHSGMGAALLKNPDNLCNILTALVGAVGPQTEYKLPISVKIRLLHPYEQTVDLVKRLVETGICRVTVHLRTTPMRPREAAIYDPDVITGIARICHERNVQIFINGDIHNRAHAEDLCAKYNLDGCMVARAAEENPSCFVPAGEEIRPWRQIAMEYLQTAMAVDNHCSNTKFVLAHIVPGKSFLYSPITRAKSIKELCEALGIDYVQNIGEKEQEKASTDAVEKSKKDGSEVVNAAGGNTVRQKEGKKRNERGTTASASPEACPDFTGVPTQALVIGTIENMSAE